MQSTRSGSPGAAGIYRKLEHAFDAAFGGAHNPLKQLGALGVALLCLLAGTGIVLYAMLDTSAQGAYRSIDEFSRQAGSAGSILRGLHRYAADAFVLITVVHLAREWLLGRFSGFRCASWLTGVPLLPLAFAAGIGGFWLNWDRLGQFSAVATAEWVDALPFMASPLARNFLGGAVSDRLFSLLVFVHLGLPLLIVFGLWFHLQRIGRPALFPPRALALGTGATLLLLALALPVRSQGPADLATVPAPVALDWMLLFVHPLTDVTSMAWVWVIVAGTLALLFALPLLRKVFPLTARDGEDRSAASSPIPVVDPAHCNGCRRCAEDCPYGAISMVPHPSGRRGLQLAQVSSHLCASCGICVGSCHTANPLRRSGRLVPGIDLPQWPLDALRRRLARGLAGEAHPYVVFGCAQGARVETLASPQVLSFSLECAGMLPPSFIEYALRGGAAGVLVAGCREGGCEFRLGQRWTAERLNGSREPHLRRSVREGWSTVWADAGEEALLRGALEALQQRTFFASQGTSVMEQAA